MGLEPLTPERRREMTRSHLLEAAAIVFARDGFHGATVDDIAAAAGFTKGAVYSNFTSKDDLFLALVDDRLDREVQMFGTELGQAPHERDAELPRIGELIRRQTFDEGWTILWLEFVLYATRHPAAREKLVESLHRQRAAVEAILENEYARRDASPSHSIPTLATVSMSVFFGLGIDRLVDPEGVTDDTLRSTLEFLYDTIGVP